MKKILIYYTHRETLGHTTRVFSLIHAIMRKYRRYVKIYVFHGGTPQIYLKRFSNVEWIDLPYPFYSKFDFRYRKLSKVFAPFHIRIRANMMLERAKKIKPDIFITEFFPFGREESKHEIIPLLNFLKNKSVKIYASVGYPYVVSDSIKVALGCYDLYDKILIHVPPDTEENIFAENIENDNFRKLYQKFFKIISGKVFYTGYIIPFNTQVKQSKIEEIREKLDAKRKVLVVASRGGGVICPKIITSSILARKYLSKDYTFIVIPGPVSSDKEIAFFNRLIKTVGRTQVFIKKYVKNFGGLLKASDISISMVGYNTSVQLLYFAKKNILIPSIAYEKGYGFCNEQVARTHLLKRCLGSSILKYQDLSPKLIAKEIEKKRKSVVKVKEVKPEWFKGGENSADFIMNN